MVQVDDMTRDRAEMRADARDERLAVLAYARTLLSEMLAAASLDVDDLEDHIIEALAELDSARERRDQIAQWLYDVLREHEELEPLRVQRAMLEAFA